MAFFQFGYFNGQHIPEVPKRLFVDIKPVCSISASTPHSGSSISKNSLSIPYSVSIGSSLSFRTETAAASEVRRASSAAPSRRDSWPFLSSPVKSVKPQ
jgi:hypothetical protein